MYNLQLLICELYIIFPLVAQLDNAADSDSEDRGFESLRAGQKREHHRQVVFSFSVRRDSNPERVSTVKKTVLWTVFRCEVRSDLSQGRWMRSIHIPSSGPKKSCSLNRIFLSKPTGLVYHHALACISSHEVCIYVALMIYNFF